MNGGLNRHKDIGDTQLCHRLKHRLPDIKRRVDNPCLSSLAHVVDDVRPPLFHASASHAGTISVHTDHHIREDIPDNGKCSLQPICLFFLTDK